MLKKFTSHVWFTPVLSLLLIAVICASAYGISHLVKNNQKIPVYNHVTAKPGTNKVNTPVVQTPTTATTPTPVTSTTTTPTSSTPVNNCSALDNQEASTLNNLYTSLGTSATNLLNEYESTDEQTNTQTIGSPTLTTAQINNDIQDVNSYINSENQNNYSSFYVPYVGTQTDKGCPITVQMKYYPDLALQP